MHVGNGVPGTRGAAEAHIDPHAVRCVVVVPKGTTHPRSHPPHTPVIGADDDAHHARHFPEISQTASLSARFCDTHDDGFSRALPSIATPIPCNAQRDDAPFLDDRVVCRVARDASCDRRNGRGCVDLLAIRTMDYDNRARFLCPTSRIAPNHAVGRNCTVGNITRRSHMASGDARPHETNVFHKQKEAHLHVRTVPQWRSADAFHDVSVLPMRVPLL